MEHVRDHRNSVTAATPTSISKPCAWPWRDREPRLAEVLADPVVRVVMRADRVDPEALERDLRLMAQKLAAEAEVQSWCND